MNRHRHLIVQERDRCWEAGADLGGGRFPVFDALGDENQRWASLDHAVRFCERAHRFCEGDPNLENTRIVLSACGASPGVGP